jgi:glucose-1-phosphate adenylyltransferase
MLEKKVLAVILGGGRGTRLYPLTKERSKPAVPLAGKYRLVDIPISNCLNSGINRIFLLTQFNTASLHRHIQNTYHFDPFSRGMVEILSAEQTEKGDAWYQGTADAVRHNLHHFADHEHEIILVLSGDQLYRMDFRVILEQHIRTKADVTIAAKPVPASQVEGLGVMQVNDSLAVEGFAEKPKDPAVINQLAMSPKLKATLRSATDEPHCLASMGIYVFSRKALAQALNNRMDDFGKEIIPSLLGQAAIYSFIYEDYWEDICTVRAFWEANLQLADENPAFNFFASQGPIYTHARYLPASKIERCDITKAIFGDGCLVQEAVIRRCVIGIRSVLKKGVTLDGVVMMGADYLETDKHFEQNKELGRPPIGVGPGSRITNAIIDKNARIGAGVVLSPEGKPENCEPIPGVLIRDGVLCIPKNTVVPDGTVI